jgi:hypothetical protein
MIVMVPPDVEKKLLELAAQRRVDPASLVASLIEKELENESALTHATDANHDDDFDPEALNRAVLALINRTPEQKRAAREWAIKEFKPKNELPPDVSPLEVMPVIKGDETFSQNR